MKTTENFMIYPVKINDAHETSIINIICEYFCPKPEDIWQIQGAAAYVWSEHKQYTHAVLIGLGNHKSCFSPFEAKHLTLKPIDVSTLRTAVTAHIYIADKTKPWAGEWWRSKNSRTQGSGWQKYISLAEMQTEIILDLTNQEVGFIKLEARKPRIYSFEEEDAEPGIQVDTK